MTPKEKAQKLVYDLYNKVNDRETLNSMYKSKQCALIAVYEILKSNPHSDPLSTDLGISLSLYDYWQEVKQEIEKL